MLRIWLGRLAIAPSTIRRSVMAHKSPLPSNASPAWLYEPTLPPRGPIRVATPVVASMLYKLGESILPFANCPLPSPYSLVGLPIAAMALMLVFSVVIYLLAGWVGLLVILIFAFYYHEKNKLNTWSDATK